MHRQLLLLGLLRREDMHGYRLNEFIERDLAFCTDIKKPTAYYLLDRLADEGYLAEVDDHEPADGRPPRKTFGITPEGERRFAELLRQNLRAVDAPTFPVDMSIAFLDALPPEEALALLHEREAALRARLESIRETPGHRSGALRLVVDHHITYLECELDWLAEVIAWVEAQDADQEEPST
jgi:DNA-binding PadR family transcriptional regulator